MFFYSEVDWSTGFIRQLNPGSVVIQFPGDSSQGADELITNIHGKSIVEIYIAQNKLLLLKFQHGF